MMNMAGELSIAPLKSCALSGVLCGRGRVEAFEGVCRHEKRA